MTDNLLALQRSAKPIRNPFGILFKHTWNGEVVELPSDGRWHTFVGPLADHMARHLWMKITYKLHDREVMKLKIAGRERDARKFNLTDEMKNKVWIVITGQPHPKYKNGVIEQDDLDIDFSILEKDMREIDSQAVMADQVTSVSQVIQQASDAALQEIGMVGGDSAHAQGAVNLGAPVDPRAGSLPTAPLQSSESLSYLTPTAPAPEDVAAQSEEFPSIKELD